MSTDRAEEIMSTESNQAILEEFFTGIASCSYYDGLCYRLYLDERGDTLFISQEASENTWRERDDGTLHEIDRVSGYCDIPQNERYTAGCDLAGYGYADWLDRMESEIAEAVSIGKITK